MATPPPTAEVVEFQAQPQRVRPDTTIGRAGLKHYGGVLTEEFLTSLQGPRGLRTYSEMSQNDAVIGGFLFAITSILSAVEWHAEPEDVNQAGDCKACCFVNTLLRDMADTWTDFIAEALSLVTYGHAYFEVVYKRRDGRQVDPAKSSKFDDGLWGWKTFEIRSQDSLDHWEFDDRDRLLGMVQRPAPSYERFFIPLKKALHFRLNPKKQNPEGASLLRSCYRSWFIKRRLQEFEAIGVERNLAGLPVLRIPERFWTDPDAQNDRGQWENVVRNLRTDEQNGIVIPSTRDEHGNLLYELTLLSTGARRQSDTNALIQRYNAEIAMAALSDFMLLGHSRVGTFALGVTKTELFATAFSYVLDVIANEINEREIPRVLALNGITGEVKLVHGKPGNVDLERFSKMVETLVKAGMPVASVDGRRERFIFEQLGLPAGDLGEGGMLPPSVPTTTEGDEAAHGEGGPGQPEHEHPPQDSISRDVPASRASRAPRTPSTRPAVRQS